MLLVSDRMTPTTRCPPWKSIWEQGGLPGSEGHGGVARALEAEEGSFSVRRGLRCRAPSHLAVEVAADRFLRPGLVVELSAALLLRVACHICHHLGGRVASALSPGPSRPCVQPLLSS